MISEEIVNQVSSAAVAVDPMDWIDRHGDYLFRFALARLRDECLAEDLVQDALVAALQSAENYRGKSSERTWLTGILKHKIIDYLRRSSHEFQAAETESGFSEFDFLFERDDEWNGHWNDRTAPVEWRETPAQCLERTEFRGILDNCLSKLPQREAAVFTLREMDGWTSEEICDALMITSSNFWVIIHRARMHLRRCIELKWFKKAEVH